MTENISPSSASDISIRDYIDMRIDSLKNILGEFEKRALLCKQEMEKQTEFARLGIEKRLDGMNEFRNSLKDQSLTFPTKNEISVILTRLEEDVRSLRETRAELAGKASNMAMWGAYIFNVITIIIAIIALIR